MKTIGLIKEGKVPADNRVALTPTQCKWIQKNFPDLRVVAQHSPDRCFSDSEYKKAGIEVVDDISDCDLLIGIKEVPVESIVAWQNIHVFLAHKKKTTTQSTTFSLLLKKNYADRF